MARYLDLMYALIKFVSIWVYPLGTAVLLWAIGLVLVALRRRRAGYYLLGGGLAWLWLWSMPAIADRVVGALEADWSFQPAESYPRADAIVVLGGAFHSGQGEWPYPDAGGGVDRYWHGARLYHAGRAPVIVLSGSRNPKRPDSWSEAESGAIFLADLGVPADAIVIDSQARTTRGNVVQIGEILRQRGLESFLLVTSARHMDRSLAAFRAEGFDPVPAPADFSVVEDPAFSIRRFVPNASALARSSEAVHEIVGGWFYRVMGWAG